MPDDYARALERIESGWDCDRNFEEMEARNNLLRALLVERQTTRNELARYAGLMSEEDEDSHRKACAEKRRAADAALREFAGGERQ